MEQRSEPDRVGRDQLIDQRQADTCHKLASPRRLLARQLRLLDHLLEPEPQTFAFIENENRRLSFPSIFVAVLTPSHLPLPSLYSS